MGREFELKYAAAADQQEAIAARMGKSNTFAMETTYYDTPDAALSARRFTLRRRLENGVSICTVKTPAENGGRGEWEVACEDIRDAVPALCKLGAPELLQSLTAGGVEEICGARFTRRAYVVTQGDTVLELALDRGVLLGGGKEQPLCEVEVELKSGSEAAAVLFGEALARQYGLQPEKRSKFRRALALAKGE